MESILYGEDIMRSFDFAVLALALASSFTLGGCGTRVPPIGEIWDDDSGVAAVALEKKIKEKVYCELNAAVSRLNNDPSKVIPVSYVDRTHHLKNITKIIKPVPETWGATLTLTLTVEEMSALNPGLSLNTPIIPGNTRFPGGIVVPGPQSYSLGLGGTLSSDATRYDKYTFFYKIKDLEDYNTSCATPDPLDQNAPKDFHGSSFLLESDLGFERWLTKMADLRSSIGVSAKSSQEVLTYDIKFDIVSSGNVTPTWKLVRVTTPVGSSPLFSAKRERTHEMLLTLGPLADNKGQPGLLAANDALSAQIGAAVGVAVKQALTQ